jgi:rhodanese-related sulfurtransferase
MSKKFHFIFTFMMLFSLLLSACGGAAPATPVVEEQPTAAPVVEEQPVVVEEAPALDLMAKFTEFWASVPPEKAFGSISAAKLSEQLAEKPAFLVDVREPAELEANGYIAGAVNIPVRELLNNLDKLPGLDDPIVIYCASGHRGGMAMMALRMLGYTNVLNLGGGTNAWAKAGLPLEKGTLAPAASISQPIVADKALFDALNDFLSNLPADKGFYTVKADKVTEFIVEKKPFIVDVRQPADWDKEGYIEGATLIPFPEFLQSLDKLPADKNASILVYCASGHRGGMVMMALRMLGYTDVINLNGGLNAWKAAKLPVVGWVDWPTVMGEFIAGLPADQGFYSVSPAKVNEMLAENPPVIIDVREPAEVETGYIAGSINIPIRELLKNLDKLPAQDQTIIIACASGHRGALGMMALRLLGYTNVFNVGGGINGWKKAELPLVTDPIAAPAAGTAPTVDATRLAYLDAYLSALPEGFGTVKAPDLNAELGTGPAPFILDVRSQAEWDADGHIEGAVLLPVNDVPANLAQLPADKAAPIIVMCKSGHRGAMVQMYLQALGYTNVRNLAGGMNAWIAAELPVAK